MASGEGAVKVVDSADVTDGSLVHVESVEKRSILSYLGLKKEDDEEEAKKKDANNSPSSHAKPNEPSRNPEVVHDGDKMKTTYDVEEDVPPSFVEQVKRKFHVSGR